MSEPRFEHLHKFLYSVDNETIDDGAPDRKLAKISSLLDTLLAKFQSKYIPEKNISTDESLLGWKGNLGWVKYIPNKKKSFSMKFYELCESTYNTKYKSLSTTSKIIMILFNSLLNKGHCLYVNNFYTSPELCDLLITKHTD